MNADDAVERLQALATSRDYERSHIEADDILLALVPEDVRAAYEALSAYFWYA